MEIAIHYTQFPEADGRSRAQVVADTARAADEGGAELFTLMDHYFQMERLGGPDAPMLEGYTTLGYLAAVTERVRLGLLVTGVTYRYPGLLAKIVSTLDVLSGGRAQLGIGAAWYEREHIGLGVPFPPVKERMGRLDETVRICRQMWSDDDGAFLGEHYGLAETVCTPKPVQGADLPIWIGGSGERRTLRLVAQHADACNLWGGEPEWIRGRLDTLRRHCESVGREYDEIRRTALHQGDVLADLDAFLARMEAYAAEGIQLISVMPPADDPAGWTAEVLDRALPRLKEL